MGIPAFYRWLVDRYPRSVVEAIEEASTVVNGVSIPADTSQPNPNGFEFDNLYLDMNGIVHPCFRPEGAPPPKTYDEVFEAVFKYIDRLFAIVRPRKLLYMAIDGVAPRAKMNQQRARRFRAAKEAGEEAAKIQTAGGADEQIGENLSTRKLDSNVITPGTEFMASLSSALCYYIQLRMNNDPGWKEIKVILSDASVPGEGEHKIMSYIRLQRNLPGFDPNTRHCLYGLDADLIMLALATHEIHFSILREDVLRPVKRIMPPIRRDKWGRLEKKKTCGQTMEKPTLKQNFQFLNLWVLRDYLSYDLNITDPTIEADLERLIDDFVFMCVFIGNDFLPNVPSLLISEGAIDLLLFVYKKEFVKMGGYLTDSCKVNLERVEHFVQAIGLYEVAIFRKRNQKQKEMEMRFGRFPVNAYDNPKGRAMNSSNYRPEVADSAVDEVKLGEDDWKNRYYSKKFETQTNIDREEVSKHAVLKYIEGICWVIHYYYQGVCSWQWFYPYHYAPFASDFSSINQLKISFSLGKPFKPIDQLMGVLPAASGHALPQYYRQLMMDPSSPILEFYPIDFEVDLNGRRFPWQAICKLPFIDESRLISEITKVEHTLTEEERKRNSAGLDLLFVNATHPLATKILSLSDQLKGDPELPKVGVEWEIDPKLSDGMNGFVHMSNRSVCPVEIYAPVDGMEIIAKNEVVSTFYNYPSFHPHIPKPQSGATIPKKIISKKDIQPPPVLWHEQSAIRGRVYSERPVRNSIEGSFLAKSAQQLVTNYYRSGKEDYNDHHSLNSVIEQDSTVKAGRKIHGGRASKQQKDVPVCPNNEIDQNSVVKNRKRKERLDAEIEREIGDGLGKEKNNDLGSLNNEIDLKSDGENRKRRKRKGSSKQQEENFDGQQKEKHDLGSLKNEIDQNSVNQKRNKNGASKQQEMLGADVINCSGVPGHSQQMENQASINIEVEQKSSSKHGDTWDEGENHTSGKSEEQQNYGSIENGTEHRASKKRERKRRISSKQGETCDEGGNHTGEKSVKEQKNESCGSVENGTELSASKKRRRRKRHASSKQGVTFVEGGNTGGRLGEEQQNENCGSIENGNEQSASKKRGRRKRKRHGSSKGETCDDGGNYTGSELRKDQQNENHGSIDHEMEQNGACGKHAKKKRKRHGASKHRDACNEGQNQTGGEHKGGVQYKVNRCSINNKVEQKSTSKQVADTHDGGKHGGCDPGEVQPRENHSSMGNEIAQKTMNKRKRKNKTKKHDDSEQGQQN